MVHGWLYRYSLTCQPVDYSNDPDELVVVNLCWWYYFCKFTEFADTIFFVLRKKFDQITNLHVIHHSIMPATVWWGVRFTPGGHATFFGTLNTFVHIVMYTYYLLAAMGPRYQKYLWWKKHLTTMQMIQFVTVFFHSVQVLFNGCNFPKIIAYAMCFNSLMFLGLFSNFYVQVRRGSATFSMTQSGGRWHRYSDWFGQSTGRASVSLLARKRDKRVRYILPILNKRLLSFLLHTGLH